MSRGSPRTSRPGLAAMRAATPAGLCPFCPEPTPLRARVRSSGRAPMTCGDAACVLAQYRCRARERYRAAHPVEVAL